MKVGGSVSGESENQNAWEGAVFDIY